MQPLLQRRKKGGETIMRDSIHSLTGEHVRGWSYYKEKEESHPLANFTLLLLETK